MVLSFVDEGENDEVRGIYGETIDSQDKGRAIYGDREEEGEGDDADDEIIVLSAPIIWDGI